MELFLLPVLRPGFQSRHLCFGEGASGRSHQKRASLDSSSVLPSLHTSYCKLRQKTQGTGNSENIGVLATS